MTDTTAGHQKGLKEFVAEYSPLLLVLPFLFFIASYLFNLSYFIIFGIKFWKIPLSSSDYIVSVNTFGIIIIFLVVYCISILILRSFVGFKRGNYSAIYLLKDESLRCKLNYKAKKRLIRSIFILIFVYLIIFLAACFFMYHEFIWINIGSIFVVLIMLFMIKNNIFNQCCPANAYKKSSKSPRFMLQIR